MPKCIFGAENDFVSNFVLDLVPKLLELNIRRPNKNPNKMFNVIENKEKALKLKEKGNDAFKRKKYEVAEKLYSEALELNLDSRPVWTNRAICRNTMKKHDDALADSLSALSIDPKNTKKGFFNI